MELLNFPDELTWQKRNLWIETEIDQAVSGSHMVSDHASALFLDLQACYCIGAWLSVIVLSISIIDAHLRETEAMDANIGTAILLNEHYLGEGDINWLRRLRNKYVHVDLNNPSLEMNVQFNDRARLEEDATKAITMVISCFFQSPGT